MTPTRPTQPPNPCAAAAEVSAGSGREVSEVGEGVKVPQVMPLAQSRARAEEVFVMRERGHTWSQIRDALGFKSVWAAPRFSDCGICGFYAAICEFMYSVRTSCGVR